VDPASETNAWEPHFRWYAKGREPMSIVGFTPDPNIAYVAGTNGGDKATVYEYDIKARKILEPAFQHKTFDALGVITSNAPADLGKPLGSPTGPSVARCSGSIRR
jgi:hypothetical protein